MAPKAAREGLAKRFKDPDGLKLVIVRDMWLTGFDCPSMHTMYLDKPMSGHNLMQAIARVNRVFKDKPGGLVVDYLGIADALKRALHTYTASGGKGEATVDQEQAVAVMLEKYEVVCDLLHGFAYEAILTAKPAQRMSGVAQAMEFILGLDDGKSRYVQAVAALSKAFALAVPHEQAMAIRDEVGLFQEIRSALVNRGGCARNLRVTLIQRSTPVGAAATDGIGNQRGHEHECLPGYLAMISTTDPESMTAEARRLEIASILARGVLRRVRMAGTAASSSSACSDECAKQQGRQSPLRKLPKGRQPSQWVHEILTDCGVIVDPLHLLSWVITPASYAEDVHDLAEQAESGSPLGR